MLEQIATVQLCVSPSDFHVGLPLNQVNGRYLLGLLFIFLQCVVWIFASVLTQHLFQETAVESSFLMTYVGVALCMLMFPLHMFHEHQHRRKIKELQGESSQDAMGLDGEMQTSPEASYDLTDQDSFDQVLNKASAYHDMVDILTTQSRKNALSKRRWSHKKHALAALHIAPTMFLSDYAYNRGLRSTTVASSTVLVSTSCIFVLFLSVVLRTENFSYGKLLGVLFAVMGTIMTTWQDAVIPQDESDEEMEQQQFQNQEAKFSQQDMLYGDVFSLMAAVGYAAYSVQAQILCPANEDLYSMTLLLAYVGLIVSVPLFPMALYKTYEMILSGNTTVFTWGAGFALLIKGLLDFVVTDYLLFRAVILTNATVANVGLVLTIPLAFLADYVVQNLSPTGWQIGGAFTVLMGFVLVNLGSSSSDSPSVDEEKKEQDDYRSRQQELVRTSPEKHHSLSSIDVPVMV